MSTKQDLRSLVYYYCDSLSDLEMEVNTVALQKMHQLIRDANKDSVCTYVASWKRAKKAQKLLQELHDKRSVFKKLYIKIKSLLLS